MNKKIWLFYPPLCWAGFPSHERCWIFKY